jgi:hypothetical protein
VRDMPFSGTRPHDYGMLTGCPTEPPAGLRKSARYLLREQLSLATEFSEPFGVPPTRNKRHSEADDQLEQIRPVKIVGSSFRLMPNGGANLIDSPSALLPRSLFAYSASIVIALHSAMKENPMRYLALEF